MKKIIKESLKIKGIKPFTEKPCKNYFDQKDENAKDEIRACDLFSYFTADIIKQEVIFIR